MDIPVPLIAAFPPSADLLLDLARQQVDDTMLREIANADYGYKADAMLAALRPIRDDGIIPAPMDWPLVEVLQLTRWCDPETPNPPPFEPGPTGRRGHQTRLFACAVLLRAMAKPATDNIDNSEDASLANCLISAQVLGEEMSIAAARFLTWRIPQDPKCYEPFLFNIALVILAIRLRSGRIPDAVLGMAAEWVLAEEARWRKEMDPYRSSNAKPEPFSLQFWRPLAAEMIREAATIRADDVRANLQLCELLLEV
jgi:hypothetical protein